MLGGDIAIEGYDMRKYNSLNEAIHECFGQDISIAKSTRMSGGDINSMTRLTLSNGGNVLLKTNSYDNIDFFRTEVIGLTAIKASNTIATPKLYGYGSDSDKRIAFLIMEEIHTTRATGGAMSDLGYAFAKMHLADTAKITVDGKCITDKKYGFITDNYIGATKQINTPKDSWIDFFRECRLEPQIKMAEHGMGNGLIKKSLALLDRLDSIMIEPDKPSLLHGDMWGGNHLIRDDGVPVLIDPATYVGHAEADIAMTEMFSPFPRDFYKAYYEINPMVSDYSDRRDIYNLYHYLNHYNLFGGGYLSSAGHIISRYV